MESFTAESLGNIGNYAFNGCVNLTGEISIGGNIGAYAFHGCVGLTGVIIGPAVTTVGASAFELCDNITTLELPAGLINSGGIGDGAFYCPALQSLTVTGGTGDTLNMAGLNVSAFGDSPIKTVTLTGGTITGLTQNVFPGSPD
jgi:hypothetical protein